MSCSVVVLVVRHGGRRPSGDSSRSASGLFFEFGSRRRRTVPLLLRLCLCVWGYRWIDCCHESSQAPVCTHMKTERGVAVSTPSTTTKKKSTTSTTTESRPPVPPSNHHQRQQQIATYLHARVRQNLRPSLRRHLARRINCLWEGEQEAGHGAVDIADQRLYCFDGCVGECVGEVELFCPINPCEVCVRVIGYV